MTEVEIQEKYIPKWAVSKVHGNCFVFDITPEQLVDVCSELFHVHQLPIKTVFASQGDIKSGEYYIHYVFGVPVENFYIIPRLLIIGTTEFPSLANSVYPASLYEGGIREMFGLEPIGRPSEAQPVLLHENWPAEIFPMRKDFMDIPLMNGHSKSMEYHFSKVDGEGIYEVPVGPVHAGIIEPGHFRFSMAGERIVRLEAKLGWMYKGSEKMFEKLSPSDGVRLAEHIAGDSSFAHSTAFCQAVEGLGGTIVSDRAQYARVIFGELERLAGHSSDLGFILSDTGFNFGLAQCGRLREQIMQACEKLTGHRFLRGVNIFGGVYVHLRKGEIEELLQLLHGWKKEFEEIIKIADDNSMVFNRLSGAGILAHQVAIDHCAVGVPARASGVIVDSRIDFPYAAYGKLHHEVSVEYGGDVLARFNVRKREVLTSLALINEALQAMPDGEPVSPREMTLRKNSYAVGISEGWRGEIVYVVVTDENGNISRVSLRDPSFLGWHLIPHAAPGNVLLDFPLINKSFNLSYSGNDK